jgi:anti-sigma regulatory factor (Ser/Thr protein kinase)
MNDSTVIKVPSDPKYLGIIRSVSHKICEISGMSDSETEDIKRAVDEACSNVIKYACRGDSTQQITVRFKITDRVFEVNIEDRGIKAEPESIRGRDLDDVRPGGLGVHFIKKAFDVAEFDEEMKEGNRLRLIRYRKDNGK